MEQLATTPAWAAFAYLVAGVLFILALRGLSSPATSQAGNRYGMAGMLIAVVTTLVLHAGTVASSGTGTYDFTHFHYNPTSLLEIAIAIAIGAAIGLTAARRIAITAMPQLVAAFHSLVGLAAVLVACAAYLNPAAFGILIPGTGVIEPTSRVEMGLGAAIGAITFSGSIIAFLKLNGNMSGKPILLPARHIINLSLLAAILILVATFAHHDLTQGGGWIFWTILGLSFAIGFLLIVPIGGADMPVVVSMLNSYSGWAAAAMGFTLQNTAMIVTRRAGRQFRRDPLLYHVRGHEPLLHQRHRGWLRRGRVRPRGRERGRSPLPARLGGRRRLHPQERAVGYHRARLRHGGQPGAARAA